MFSLGRTQIDYTMQMVWHKYVLIKYNGCESFRQHLPLRQNHFANITERYIPIDNIPKETLTVLSANSDKISPLLAIIVALQPYRMAMMSLWIIFSLHFMLPPT